MINMAVVRVATALTGIVAVAVACSPTAAVRRQALLFVDVDAPVVGQLRYRSDLSSDAAIDSVRVDLIDFSGQPYDERDIVAGDAVDWPVSFGLAPQDGASVAHLRLRAYRSAFAPADPTDPSRRAVVIDRLVDVPLPASGVGMFAVQLTGECFGAQPSLLASHTTCVDGATTAGAPSMGVTEVSVAPASRIGTWPKAIAQPCTAPSPDGAGCVSGGATFLGDDRLAGITDDITLPSTPLRPAALRPFYLDRTEFTVGRFRALAGQIRGTLPATKSALLGFEQCTWLGTSDGTNDGLPLNCVTWATAGEACALVHGALPKESQWEHAASGHGARRAYPWGDATPSCCTANLRFPIPGGACTSAGPVPVGSFASTSCGGVDDVSLDGVLDLAGNVSEWVDDTFASYDDACWGSGAPLDPECPVAAGSDHVARGGNYEDELPTTGFVATRHLLATGSSLGFRCVYPGVRP